MTNDAELGRIFTDICRGYSPVIWGKNSVYVKHFSHFEQSDIELERKKYFDAAIKKRIPTLEEKNAWLIKERLWSADKDKKIRDFKDYGEGLKKSKSKSITKSQENDFQKLIDENDNELNRLIYEKSNLIGFTAESYADSKMQSHYVKLGFFKDTECKTPLFSEKQFNNLDDEEMFELMDIYIEFIKQFSISNIKKIAISQFFTSYFYISEDNFNFFHKPLYTLTFNQVNLISYGSYFKSLMASIGDSITEEMRTNPEKLEEFANRKNNAKSSGAESKNGYKMVIGATEKDDGAVLGGAKNDLFSKGEIDTAWNGVKSGQIKMNQ